MGNFLDRRTTHVLFLVFISDTFAVFWIFFAIHALAVVYLLRCEGGYTMSFEELVGCGIFYTYFSCSAEVGLGEILEKD